MAKKRVKMGLAYFVTIIAALVIIGGLGIYLLTHYTVENNSDGLQNQLADDTPAQAVSDESYVPTSAESRTGLFIYDSGKSRSDGICIALIRLAADIGEIDIVPLQSDILAEVDGTQNTLYEFYRLGGITQCKKAVENVTGIAVDKYMKLSENAFTIFADYMGNISYDVPYNLIYENVQTGETIIIKSGEQTLDSTALCKLLTFPEYKNGEEYRAVVMGTALTALINQGTSGILRDGMDTVFSVVINGDIETDITRYDYEDVSRALSYIINNYSSPVRAVIPSGVYDGNAYVLDESFTSILPSRLYLE